VKREAGPKQIGPAVEGSASMMDLSGKKDFYLEPGHVCFSSEPIIIRTVLGSCVAVCLWDRDLCQGGVSHFIQPWAHSRDKATPEYGNAATVALLRLLEETGSRREHLVAQVAGGAKPEMPGSDDLGFANIEAAHRILERKGIPIASQDVGGTMGRKIIFDTYTGHLVVLKVHRVRDSDWKQE
jgi:chemotaxis protein CheD